MSTLESYEIPSEMAKTRSHQLTQVHFKNEHLLDCKQCFKCIKAEMVKFMSGEVSRRNSDVSKFPGDQKPQTGNNGGLSAGEHFILFNVKASEALSEVKTGESKDTREIVDPQSRIRDFLDRGNLTRKNLQAFDNRRLSNEEMIEALSTYMEHQFTAQTQRQMTALQGWLKLAHTADPDRYSELQRTFENLDKRSQFREFRQKTLDSLSKVTSDAGRNRLVDSWIEYAKLCHEEDADAGLLGPLHHSDREQAGISKSSSTHTEDGSDVYFTSEGRPVEIFNMENSVQVLPLEVEEQWLRSRGYAGKVKSIEPPTNITNSYGYALADRKGMLGKYEAETIIEDNFEPVRNPQVGDRLIYRSATTQELIYAAIVTEISDGKVSGVSGQIKPCGSIFEHHPDLIKEKNPCNWELLRLKEGASLKPWTELFVRGKDYVTSKGRSHEVFHSIKDMPAIPPDLEERMLGTLASEMTRIEGPNPGSNCFGHGILDDKGVIHNVDDIIEDDFTLVEVPEVGDRLVGRDPETGRAVHMAIIRGISDGKVSQVSSKEAQLGRYGHSFNILKKRHKDLNWEIRRRNPLVEDYEVTIE